MGKESRRAMSEGIGSLLREVATTVGLLGKLAYWKLRADWQGFTFAIYLMTFARFWRSVGSIAWSYLHLLLFRLLGVEVDE